MKLTYDNKTYEHLRLEVCSYANGRLAMRLSQNQQPFATLTVNLPNYNVPVSDVVRFAFIDTYNYPWIEKFISDNKLGTFAGTFGISGFAEYPLYGFSNQRLAEVLKEGADDEATEKRTD